MDLQQFFGVLRARWKFVAVTLILGSLLTGGLALTKSPEYASTGRVFIGVPETSPEVNDYLSTYLVAQRTASYAELATDPVLLQNVIDRTGMDLTPGELGDRISTTVVTSTQIIEIRATGPTPEEARDLAEAEMEELVALVNTFERRTNEEAATVVARSTGTPLLDPSPVGIPLVFIIAIGIILSLLAGIVGALVKDLLDTRIKSREDVENTIGLPVISALPLDRTVAKQSRSLVAAESPLGEAFRVLRTNLRFADIDAKRQMTLVTSSLENEGKTLTAVNLALSLASSGESVLLIDGDLRSPSVASSLGLENAVGMLSVLLGRIPLDDAIQRHPSGLHVLATGPKPPNPAEVLVTDAVADLFRSVRSRYDVVVVDAPPVLPVADAGILVKYVDGVVLLARFGRTRRDVLRLAADRITGLGGRLDGAVLNGVPKGAAGAYGYGYEYGYSSAPESETPPRGRRRLGSR